MIPTFKRKQSVLDLTPLVDVIFLLLIFFMLTMPSETSTALPITLPSATGEKELISTQTLSISITSSGLIFIDDRIYNTDEIEPILISRRELFSSVLIRGDHKSQLGSLVQIWNLCQTAGYTDIKIAINKN